MGMILGIQTEQPGRCSVSEAGTQGTHPPIPGEWLLNLS